MQSGNQLTVCRFYKSCSLAILFFFFFYFLDLLVFSSLKGTPGIQRCKSCGYTMMLFYLHISNGLNRCNDDDHHHYHDNDDHPWLCVVVLLWHAIHFCMDWIPSKIKIHKHNQTQHIYRKSVSMQTAIRKSSGLSCF